MKLSFAVPLLFSVVFAGAASAQTASPSNWEAAAGYNFVHTNAPPTGCGCFLMNGGTGSISRQLTPAFGLAGEFNGATNGKVDAAGHSLTLFTYLVGPRYRFVSARGRFAPFGQILLGGAHASGGLYSSGSANAFAASLGGGVDIALSPHFAVRAVQAEYLLTLLPNGVNSRQNNFNLTTGLVVHFGAK